MLLDLMTLMLTCDRYFTWTTVGLPKENVNQTTRPCAPAILRAKRQTCTQTMRDNLELLTLYNRRRFLRFLLVFKIVHRLQCPEQLTDYLQLRSSLHSRSLRDNTLLHLLKVKTSIGQSTFQYSAAADWNSLPRSIREITSLARFKSKLYNYLRDLDRATHRCSCN